MQLLWVGVSRSLADLTRNDRGLFGSQFGPPGTEDPEAFDTLGPLESFFYAQHYETSPLYVSRKK